MPLSVNVSKIVHSRFGGLPASSDLNYSTSKLIYRISYPTWGGIGIKHDPTYVAYYVPNLLTVSTPVPAFPMIIVYLAIAVAAIAMISFLVVKRLRKNSMPTEGLR